MREGNKSDEIMKELNQELEKLNMNSLLNIND